jgi:hypothetical protein
MFCFEIISSWSGADNLCVHVSYWYIIRNMLVVRNIVTASYVAMIATANSHSIISSYLNLEVYCDIHIRACIASITIDPPHIWFIIELYKTSISFLVDHIFENAK